MKWPICTTAHPVGCAARVRAQIDCVQAASRIGDGPRSVLVVGATGGYGLPSRVAGAFRFGAASIGVGYERPPTNGKTASAGWYNAVAFDHYAKEAGLYARSFNGDAFSDELKAEVCKIAAEEVEPFDLVVYSLAAPLRLVPGEESPRRSVIKPIGDSVTLPTITADRVLGQKTIQPATDEEIVNTVAVMGGDDWSRWISVLESSGLLAENCRTISYTYVGGPQT